MLTKQPLLTFVPGTPGVPGVDYRPAYTECHEVQDGHYETQTRFYRWAALGTAAQLPIFLQTGQFPAGANILEVYEELDPYYPDLRFPGQLIVYYSAEYSVWVNDGPPRSVCTEYPEREAVPAVPAVPSRWDASQIFAWDAGANSAVAHDDNCRVVFTMPRVVGAMVGLTQDVANVVDVSRFAAAFYFFQTPGGQPRYRIREGGRTLGEETGYVANDTEFEIRRVGSSLEMRVDGAVVRRPSALVAGSVIVGTALYASGDAVPSAELDP